MSQICLHCQENETSHSQNICDSCYDNAGEYLEQNVALIRMIPEMLDVIKTASEHCERLPDDARTELLVQAIEDVMAKAA